MSRKVTDKIAAAERQGFWKGGLFMTFYVGVDIAKYEHVASILDSGSGELRLDSFRFGNDLKGFESLLSHLSKLNREDVVIGFESTAHYHQALFSCLNGKGYECILINPLIISRFRKLSLRDAKNDSIDSRIIAQFLLFEHDHLKNEEFVMNDLKELCLQRDFLIQTSTSLKIKMVSYLDRVFPELENVIPKGTLHTKGLRAVLKEYPSAQMIAKTRIDHLVNLAKKASHNRYKEATVRRIRDAAKTSAGFHSDALALKIRQSIESLESIEKQIDEVEGVLCSLPSVQNSPLHKIKGINSIEVAYILSAIISIERFSSAKKLIAYAGLNPKVRQSGTWEAKSTRMSKRGNVLLRYALVWTANNVRKHSPSMKEYYEKKRSQGKGHYSALGHCAAKLCRYIFYILNHPEEDFIS
jgi:transposase